MVYAGFWLRVVAAIIDGLLFAIVNTIVKLISTGNLMLFETYTTYEHHSSNYHTDPTWYGALLIWLYYTLLESSNWQGTLGKHMLKLKVTDENGDKIGFGRANARYWSKIFSAMILLIGFFMIGFTKRKQGLHDFIARTLVIKAPQNAV